MNQPLPDNRAGILARLTAERGIAPKGSQFAITNLGAILFAKKLKAFDRLARKALRVVIYQGTSRVETIKEQPGAKGYAIGYEGAVGFIRDQLPQNEQIHESLRKEVRMYPEIAICELVANAIIHQDFSLTGTGPMVEIISDRIEFTNPGRPLIDPLRFIDEPPRSRNKTLAALMRRMNICEDRGSGVDKVIFNIELFQLPAPDFQVTDNHTKADSGDPQDAVYVTRIPTGRNPASVSISPFRSSERRIRSDMPSCLVKRWRRVRTSSAGSYRRRSIRSP